MLAGRAKPISLSEALFYPSEETRGKEAEGKAAEKKHSVQKASQISPVPPHLKALGLVFWRGFAGKLKPPIALSTFVTAGHDTALIREKTIALAKWLFPQVKQYNNGQAFLSFICQLHFESLQGTQQPTLKSIYRPLAVALHRRWFIGHYCQSETYHSLQDIPEKPTGQPTYARIAEALKQTHSSDFSLRCAKIIQSLDNDSAPFRHFLIAIIDSHARTHEEDDFEKAATEALQMGSVMYPVQNMQAHKPEQKTAATQLESSVFRQLSLAIRTLDDHLVGTTAKRNKHLELVDKNTPPLYSGNQNKPAWYPHWSIINAEWKTLAPLLSQLTEDWTSSAAPPLTADNDYAEKPRPCSAAEKVFAQRCAEAHPYYQASNQLNILQKTLAQGNAALTQGRFSKGSATAQAWFKALKPKIASHQPLRLSSLEQACLEAPVFTRLTQFSTALSGLQATLSARQYSKMKHLLGNLSLAANALRKRLHDRLKRGFTQLKAEDNVEHKKAKQTGTTGSPVTFAAAHSTQKANKSTQTLASTTSRSKRRRKQKKRIN